MRGLCAVQPVCSCRCSSVCLCAPPLHQQITQQTLIFLAVCPFSSQLELPTPSAWQHSWLQKEEGVQRGMNLLRLSSWLSGGCEQSVMS